MDAIAFRGFSVGKAWSVSGKFQPEVFLKKL
jgi:hypothetical protein